MLIQEQEIQYILDNADWVIPLFEDEVPNTFPVSRIYSWETMDEDMKLAVERKAITNFKNNSPHSLYIGIPYCHEICKYCIYRPEKQKSVPLEYVRLLGNELKKYSESGVSFNSIRQIYVGGGTPSLLSYNQMRELFRLLEQYFSLDNVSSFCFELDPTTCTKKKVNFLHKSGVNRFSIGVQCMDDNVLKCQGRAARVEHIKDALKTLENKKVYFNVDLIYGLPDQSIEVWRKSLSQLVESFFVPEFTLYKFRVGRKTDFPDNYDFSQDTSVLEKRMFAEAAEFLGEKDYERVRPCHWVAKNYRKAWELYRFAPMSDQTAALEPDTASQIGIGGDAISHVNDLLVRNLDAKNYIKQMEKGLELAYESYYCITDDDKAIRQILHTIEKDYKIPTVLLPRHALKLQKHLEKLTDQDSKAQKGYDYLLTKNKEDKEYQLTENGLLFYDYIENLIIHEIKKFDDRLAFSTPQEHDWIAKVATAIKIINVSSKSNLKVLELGASVGALSIPIMRFFAQHVKRLDWTAYDYDLDRLLYYDRRLRKGYSISERENNDDNWSLKLTKHTKVTLIHSNVESTLLCSSVNEEYDIVFMPSFLNHISLKMDCLRFAWKSLKENGLVVLGYPSGAWFGALIGPTWRYDKKYEENDDIYKHISKLWRDYFATFANFQMYFTRPIDDFGNALPGKMETIPHTLRFPNIETFFHFLLSDGFSFLRRRKSADNNSTLFKRLVRFQTEARESLRDIRPEHKSPFAYTWQFVSKR